MGQREKIDKYFWQNWPDIFYACLSVRLSPHLIVAITALKLRYIYYMSQEGYRSCIHFHWEPSL